MVLLQEQQARAALNETIRCNPSALRAAESQLAYHGAADQEAKCHPDAG